MRQQSSYDLSMQDEKTNALEISTGPRPTDLISDDPNKTPAITPSEPEPRIGVRGYLRMLRIFFSFTLFGLRVFLNTREWTGKKRDVTSEQRHQEGEMLRDKFLALGP